LNATSRGAPSGQAVAIPLHSRPGARRAGQREPRGQPAAMVDGRQRADVAIDHATLLAGGMWASVWSRCGAGREPLSGRMVTRSSSHLHLIELTLVWPCTRNLSFSSSSFVHGPTLSLAMASTLPKRRAKDRPSPAPSGSGAAKWETLARFGKRGTLDCQNQESDLFTKYGRCVTCVTRFLERLLFVQIQLMCGAARSNLLSVNASSDDPNQLNVF
jgi:hypothetical protein